MRYIYLIIISLIGLNSFAQQYKEIAPMITINPDATTWSDTLDMEFSFPCTAFIGEYGVGIDDDDEICVTQWMGDLFAKYDQSGNLLETFSIPGISGVRDITYDGQFFYGSPSDYYFYVFDIVTKQLIATVPTPMRIRGITFDPEDEAWWISEHWSSTFYKVDATGSILDSLIPTGITLDAISGIAFDYQHWYSDPFIWGFSQDSTGAIIAKYDIASQSQLGSMIDVSGLASGGIAGGLSMNSMGPMSGNLLIGMIQNQLVFALDLDYANQLVRLEATDFIKTLDVYPNPAGDILRVKLTMDGQANVKFRILDNSGKTIYDQLVNIDKLKTLEFDINKLDAGFYFIQIDNPEGYSITKKFIVVK